MLAGRMKYKLILLQPKVVTNSFGEESVEYVQFRTVNAELVRHSGNLSNEVGEHFANYTIEFNIRDAHPVKEGWRIIHVGGYLYNVNNILPNIDRGFITLKCERVNE